MDHDTLTQELTTLATDRNASVRWHVAGDWSTPSEVLAVLAKDVDVYVRRRVAFNPSTAPETLTLLAGDSSSEVRWRVAFNPSTPAETLTLLASDPDPRVRCQVAESPSAPGRVVLLDDDERGFQLVFFAGRYWAGCREFTAMEALEHWANPNHQAPRSARLLHDAVLEHVLNRVMEHEGWT